MRVSLLILLLATAVYTQEQSDTEVVVKLLEDLKQEALDELSKLGDRYSVIQENKQKVIAALTQAKLDQSEECFNREQDVQQKQIEIDLANDFIEWMKTRQTSNLGRVSVLSSNVCEHNNNYIDNIKNARILLRLINFLRTALQSYNSETSLSQTHASEGTLSELTHMVFLYKEYRQSGSLAQTKQEEGESNPDFQLTGTVEQLIEMLNQMEKEINLDITNGQNGQVQVGVTFSEFKLRLEKENEVFDKQINKQNDLITNFQNQLVTLNNRVDKCHLRFDEVKIALITAQEDLKYVIEASNDDRKRKQEEIDLFDWLIKHYQGIDAPEPTSRDGIIDYTPEHEMTDAWASSSNEDEGDGEQNGHDGVIDYTPEHEMSDAWASDEEGEGTEGQEEITEEVSEESTEESTEEAAEEQAHEMIEETIEEETTEESAHEMIEETIEEETTEESAHETIEETIEEETTEETIEETTEESAHETIEETIEEETTEETIEETTEESAHEMIEETIEEETTEEATEETTEESNNNEPEVLIEKSKKQHKNKKHHH